MLYIFPTCINCMLCFVPHLILNIIIESYQQYSDEKDTPKSISILRSSNNSISRLLIILAKVLF